MKMFRVRDSELAKRDPLGTRLAERGLVARAARACRRCARVALQYSPTAHICAGTPKRPICEVADFCALVKESVQAECRDKMLALRYFGMTEASGKDSVGVPKGSMKVADFLKMTEDDRKVVR